MEQTIVKEVAEVCPYCGEENIYHNIDVVGQDYVAQCKNCHKDIMLCGECMNADDNPRQRCNWSPKNGCFRHRQTYYVVINEQLSRTIEVKAKSMLDAVSKVGKAYANGEITLDYSDYVDGSTEIYDATNETIATYGEYVPKFDSLKEE